MISAFNLRDKKFEGTSFFTGRQYFANLPTDSFLKIDSDGFLVDTLIDSIAPGTSLTDATLLGTTTVSGAVTNFTGATTTFSGNLLQLNSTLVTVSAVTAFTASTSFSSAILANGGLSVTAGNCNFDVSPYPINGPHEFGSVTNEWDIIWSYRYHFQEQDGTASLEYPGLLWEERAALACQSVGSSSWLFFTTNLQPAFHNNTAMTVINSSVYSTQLAMGSFGSDARARINLSHDPTLPAFQGYSWQFSTVSLIVSPPGTYNIATQPDIGLTGTRFRDIYCRTLYQISDKRLKKSLGLCDCDMAISLIKNVSAQKYSWTEDPSSDEYFGFFAQDFFTEFSKFPGMEKLTAVRRKVETIPVKDGLDEEIGTRESDVVEIDPTQLIPLLWQAVKALVNRVEVLEGK